MKTRKILLHINKVVRVLDMIAAGIVVALLVSDKLTSAFYIVPVAIVIYAISSKMESIADDIKNKEEK